MLMHGRAGWAMATLLAHVLGSLLMTFAGFALVRWLVQAAVTTTWPWPRPA